MTQDYANPCSDACIDVVMGIRTPDVDSDKTTYETADSAEYSGLMLSFLNPCW